jgi:hypothetical protein
MGVLLCGESAQRHAGHVDQPPWPCYRCKTSSFPRIGSIPASACRTAFWPEHSCCNSFALMQANQLLLLLLERNPPLCPGWPVSVLRIGMPSFASNTVRGDFDGGGRKGLHVSRFVQLRNDRPAPAPSPQNSASKSCNFATGRHEHQPPW